MKELFKKKCLNFLFAFAIIGTSLGIALVVDAYTRTNPIQQTQQLIKELAETKFLLKKEKEDTRDLILEIGELEKNRNQLNNKLIKTQNILNGLVKDEKINIKDLAPLIPLGYNFGAGAELPSSLPDSVRQSDRNALWP